jgi:CRP/FNR family transcriptional regulator, cyclic AMP receptor protein
MSNRVQVTFGKHLRFKETARIFTEGQSGSEMYVILSGKVRIFISSGNYSLTLAKLKKGDFFGEMALLEELPRSASAEAINDVELIALEKDDFKFLIQQHPDIAMKVLGKFSARLRDADHLIGLLLMGDETGQILHFIVKQALLYYGSEQNLPKEWFLPMNCASLAELSGINYDNVDAVLKELERIGILSIGEEGFIVTKHRKLKYYLEYLGWKGRC